MASTYQITEGAVSEIRPQLQKHSMLYLVRPNEEYMEWVHEAHPTVHTD